MDQSCVSVIAECNRQSTKLGFASQLCKTLQLSINFSTNLSYTAIFSIHYLDQKTVRCRFWPSCVKLLLFRGPHLKCVVCKVCSIFWLKNMRNFSISKVAHSLELHV